MAWFKVDDKLHSSRRILSIPRRHRLAAIGLWTIAGSWAADHERDGLIPEYMIEEWGGTKSIVDALLKAGLWLRVSELDPDMSPEFLNSTFEFENSTDEFLFRNWDKYQPTKAQLESDRKKNREKLRDWRDRNRVTDPDVTGLQDGSNPVVTPPPSRPVPTRPEVSKDTSIDRGATKINRPLPKDWKPTPEHQERAFEYGLEIDREVIKFTAHAEEKGRLAKNWNAAFTRWLTNAKEYQTRSQQGGFSRPSIDRQGDLLKSEAARIQAKYENQQPRLEIEQ